MASLERDSRSGHYRIRFRVAGAEYKRSLKTKDRRHARSMLGRVENTLMLLESGHIDLPADADAARFVLTAGKQNGKPKPQRSYKLKELLTAYHEQLPKGAKEASTIATERLHVQHLIRHLGAKTLVQAITKQDIQNYVHSRSEETWQGRAIGPGTIGKELATFRLIWNWAVSLGYLNGPSPTIGVTLPKSDQRPPFMTRADIERTIARGGMSDEDTQKLWSTLFLTVEEVHEVLELVKKGAGAGFVHPMFCFAAHTGARRSEMLRSRIDDFDFDSGTVLIREKKRSHQSATTFRRVALSAQLASVMKDWFENHPGGQYTLAQELVTARGKHRANYLPLTTDEARDHFRRALDGEQWSVIRGFHVFRHSFASNLAAAGVDQRLIDEWMGHQTDEMRRRYRHLFPAQERQAIDAVFCNNGA